MKYSQLTWIVVKYNVEKFLIVLCLVFEHEVILEQEIRCIFHAWLLFLATIIDST